MHFVLLIKCVISSHIWLQIAFVEVTEIVGYTAEIETTVLTPNYSLHSGQHITNLYDYIANLVEKLRFYSCFQLPKMGPTEQRQYFTVA